MGFCSKHGLKNQRFNIWSELFVRRSFLQTYLLEFEYVSRSMRVRQQFCTKAFERKESENYVGKNMKQVDGENNEKLFHQGKRRNKFIPTTPGPVPNPSLRKFSSRKLAPEVGTSDIPYANLATRLPLTRGSYGIDENLKSRMDKVEEAAKVGSESNPLMAGDANVEVERQEELTEIKDRDVINLQDLLFTENRDYLVKYNDDQKVKAEHLAGKVILMYFLVVTHDVSLGMERFLIDIYNDLLPNNCFEVIFVALDDVDVDVDAKYRERVSHSLKRDAQKNFENLFSQLPWTAIPFSDRTSRICIAKRFGISEQNLSLPISVVIDSRGTVLKYKYCYLCFLFETYGTLGYPFSNERIEFLNSEDDAVAKQPSLERLLGSPGHNYVISNKEDMVPIHTLKDKVVALYFYEDGLFTDDKLTEQLKTAYKELKSRENFEVVLLYLYDTADTLACTNEKSFWKKFKTMPWLALPFKDPTHKKLKRIFGFPWDLDGPELTPRLVIFGSNAEFVDPCGADILMNFGVPAYPFTREKVAKLEAEKIKETKLEMLWDPNTVFKKDGLEVKFSQFTGKRVLILFESNRLRSGGERSLKWLKEKYLQMRGTDHEFEVIHVKDKSSKTNIVVDLPWSVHYCCEGYSVPGGAFGFNYYCGPKRCFSDLSIHAFDRDGTLVRKTLFPTFTYKNFPFYGDSLEKELFELNFAFFWGYWDRGIQQIYKREQ